MSLGHLLRVIGASVIGMAVLGALMANIIAPNPPSEQFRDFLLAPPMRPQLVDESGYWHLPFVYPLRLVSRIERRFEDDRTRRVTLKWLTQGKLLSTDAATEGPLLLLGADSLGRDIFARMMYGARASLSVALVATIGALLLGTVIGTAAGYAGGAIDEGLMRAAEFVLVLPTVYVVLGLRAALPLVLPASTTFLLVSGLLALVGWPFAARGARAIVATELRREYAAAARSVGAGRTRLLVRHILPATKGFLAVQATLLLPGFILAEATLSFVGLGFAEPTASWGSMLREAANIRALAEFPWLASPAIAIAAVVLGFNLLLESTSMTKTQATGSNAAVVGPESTV